ncbi:hypothetical protein ILYODFUR_034773 [Ilyodon furcidens]|uniref:Ig-like domain-containing protein n=1 Tax=Ilyodon furcidens TaxID=33524 RepID=A0ABV0SRM3_9TELE
MLVFIPADSLMHQETNKDQTPVSICLLTMKNDEVTLNCSVSTYDGWDLTVVWLYEGKDIDPQMKDLKTTQSGCSATVTFPASNQIYTPRSSELFKCQVQSYSGSMKEFNLMISLLTGRTGEINCLQQPSADL